MAQTENLCMQPSLDLYAHVCEAMEAVSQATSEYIMRLISE